MSQPCCRISDNLAFQKYLRDTTGWKIGFYATCKLCGSEFFLFYAKDRLEEVNRVEKRADQGQIEGKKTPLGRAHGNYWV